MMMYGYTEARSRFQQYLKPTSGGVFLFPSHNMSPSNNTYFDVLYVSIVQLINPHVPLSKRPGLKPSSLVRSACSPVDTTSRFQKF